MQLHTLLSLAMTFASVGIVLIILVLSALLIFYRAVWRKKKGGPMHLPWHRILWWCVFACYCFVVLCATIFMRFPSEMPERAYPLFYSYQEAWITGSESSWRNIILNFCMFMPLGFLLPLRWKRLQRGLWILLAGFGFSLMIECVQLLSRRGMFEPDDLLGNTVGALIGYGFFLLWDELRKKAMKKLWKKFPEELPRSPKRVLAAQLPLLLTALAFLILFVKYQSMPLGVHPDEPLDRPSKKHLTVTSMLEFPSEGENLVASSGSLTGLTQSSECMVWQSKHYTLATAKEEAERFFSSLGTHLDTDNLHAYDNEIFFHSVDQRYSLIFAYHGGTYYLTDYQLLKEDGSTPEKALGAGQAEVASALQRFGIDFSDLVLFDSVQFTERANGWYRFTFHPVHTKQSIVLGFLDCCYYEGSQIGEVNNQLLECSPYKTFPILSEKEAYEKIVNGDFSYTGETNSEPVDLMITDCELTYVTDSKGFLQPTYAFTGILNGKETIIKIPALR